MYCYTCKHPDVGAEVGLAPASSTVVSKRETKQESCCSYHRQPKCTAVINKSNVVNMVPSHDGGGLHKPILSQTRVNLYAGPGTASASPAGPQQHQRLPAVLHPDHLHGGGDLHGLLAVFFNERLKGNCAHARQRPVAGLHLSYLLGWLGAVGSIPLHPSKVCQSQGHLSNPILPFPALDQHRFLRPGLGVLLMLGSECNECLKSSTFAGCQPVQETNLALQFLGGHP